MPRGVYKKISERCSRYIDGRSLKDYFCKDCGKKISQNSGIYGLGKCRSCSKKGHIVSLEARLKISQNGIGRKQSEETIRKRAEKLKGHKVPQWLIEKLKIINKNRVFTPELRKRMSEAHKGKFALEKHPNWQGGKSFELYPLGWTKTFKEQIRVRDSYKCQICGCPEVECKTKLHVHHIDYDKKNLDKNNLTSLCNSCHTKTGFNKGYWKNYFQTIGGQSERSREYSQIS